MKRRQILITSASVLLAIILAFLLREPIRSVIIIPLAYLWWLFNLIYSSVPQVFLWITLLAICVLIIITNFVNLYSFSHSFEQPSKMDLGPVESLAGLISKTKDGTYYKWKIANRLGELWRQISKKASSLGGSEEPEAFEALDKVSGEVINYLEAGLKESFVDYPLPPFPFFHRRVTPFDLDVNEAVEFLESQMEARNGGKRSKSV